MKKNGRFMVGLVGVAAVVTYLIWTGVSETMVYYLTPSELMAKVEVDSKTGGSSGSRALRDFATTKDAKGCDGATPATYSSPPVPVAIVPKIGRSRISIGVVYVWPSSVDRMKVSRPQQPAKTLHAA